MGVTTTLPSAVQLTGVGDSYTESGTTTVVANSGTTTFNFDDSVISVSAANLTPQTITPGSTNQGLPFNFDIGAMTITAVGNGSTTLEIVSGNPSVAPTVNILVTVGAVAEDESYLNKRGLAHFWENIDDIKQDKLTAGAGISITNDVISATGDSTLSPTSTNPIQNQAVYNAIGDVESILTTLNIGGGAQ